jgi:hypothetical protein
MYPFFKECTRQSLLISTLPPHFSGNSGKIRFTINIAKTKNQSIVISEKWLPKLNIVRRRRVFIRDCTHLGKYRLRLRFIFCTGLYCKTPTITTAIELNNDIHQE